MLNVRRGSPTASSGGPPVRRGSPTAASTAISQLPRRIAARLRKRLAPSVERPHKGDAPRQALLRYQQVRPPGPRGLFRAVPRIRCTWRNSCSDMLEMNVFQVAQHATFRPYRHYPCSSTYITPELLHEILQMQG